MSKLILIPPHSNCSYSSYENAAKIVRNMYFQITGKKILISDTDDHVSDLFVIGSDGVNNFVMNEILEQNIESLGIRYGTDDYTLLSYRQQERRIVVLAGGRVRSTIYAIYDFFERFADCHYFWDGDIIPHKDDIILDDFHICESPRFEYRGLRYFAHRGLKRFQAEHWSFDDWKKELDWMMKKRLNFFMLRIGNDDLWQRAFPNVVKYPESYLNIKDLKGYNDRSDFWTLKYRGELREKILTYARKLDLIYPTDCGTMTHWYSRTPEEFLNNKKPSFIPQYSKSYIEDDTGKVWDFRENENMNNYMHLTHTMVNEYDKQTEYFHTIGLGEREISINKTENLNYKLIAYRKIAENIRTSYPNAKLFLASWDFVGWWTGEEVQKLVKELNPENTIILDYTSDVNDPEQSFLNWGVVNNFPWVFGLFHAYESESELRGNYKRIEERLNVAASDPYCKGMILWPELSHSDPIVLEYLSENAWHPLKNTIEETVTEFCRKRYGKNAKQLIECWQKFLPFVMLGDWGGYSRREENEPNALEFYNTWVSHSDLWVNPLKVLHLKDDIRYCKQTNFKIERSKTTLSNVIGAIESLASYEELWGNNFFKRDAIDIIRTALGRYMNFLLASALYDTDIEIVKKKQEVYFILHDTLKKLLSLSDDFSVYQTLIAIQTTAPTNPNFEKTLKENIGCSYCRQYAFELMDTLFKKEARLVFGWMMNGKHEYDAKKISEEAKQIFENFLDTPLPQIKEHNIYKPSEIAYQSANCLKLICEVL